MVKISLDSLDRNDLLRLQRDIKEKLKEFRPYRIRQREVRCGKGDCWCVDGSSGHGPYLYAVYRDKGKTKTVSLGPKLLEREMLDRAPGLPDVFDYINVPDHVYLEMTRAGTQEWVYITLTDQQFEARHGINRAEDKFDRPGKYWGKREDHDRFQADYDLALEAQQLPFNPWSGYGVGTLSGVALLEELERRGYYMKY